MTEMDAPDAGPVVDAAQVADRLVAIVPEVTRERLNALLSEQTESESLDYKTAFTLKGKAQVEFARDFAAMSAYGGYLVVGVDRLGRPKDGGIPESEVADWDEANLRQILAKYLDEPINLLSAVHDVDGARIACVYIAPHPDGWRIFRTDGQYHDPVTNKSKTLFSKGDVFVRHGTSCERWQQSDFPRLFQRRDERIRQEAADEFSRALSAALAGQQAQAIAASSTAAYSWSLNVSTFASVTQELLRRGDTAPVRLLLLEAAGRVEAAALTADEAAVERLLDRIVIIGAVALTVGDQAVQKLARQTLQRTYASMFAAPDVSRTDLAVRPVVVWLGIATRILALGALAVRLEELDVVHDLALLQPQPQGPSAYDRVLLRHAVTMTARAGLNPKHEQRVIPGGLVYLARAHVNRLQALRPDQPEDLAYVSDSPTPAPRDVLLDSICQFDFLWCVVAVAANPGSGTRHFYPTFCAYYPQRVEALASSLTTSASAASALAPPDGEGLPEAIGIVLALAEREAANYGRFFSIHDPALEELIRAAQR